MSDTTSTEIIVPAEQNQPPAPQALADLRSAGMLMPVQKMERALAEYTDRRDTFRQWLLSQLKSGIHYGFPPTTEPISQMRDGVRWYQQGKGDRATWYPETQWRPKPSLYDAGAQFLIDLMGVRAEYEPDLGAWEMSGKAANRYFYRCRLFSRATGELLGEGIGACQASNESRADQSSNAAIKKAKKSSLVSAVKDTYGLSDLFTQDAPPEEPPVDQPKPKADAPKAAPRGQQVTMDELTALKTDWQAVFQCDDKEQFREWVSKTVGLPMQHALSRSAWDKDKLRVARLAIEQEITRQMAETGAKSDDTEHPPGQLFDNYDERNSLP